MQYAMKNDVICLNFQGSKSNNMIIEDGKSYSLNAMHGHDVHVICFQNTGRGWWNEDIAAQTLRTPAGEDSMKANLVCYSMNSKQICMNFVEDHCNTLAANDYKEPQIVCYEKSNE